MPNCYYVDREVEIEIAGEVFAVSCEAEYHFTCERYKDGSGKPLMDISAKFNGITTFRWPEGCIQTYKMVEMLTATEVVKTQDIEQIHRDIAFNN